jgi:hypothetical protein
MHFFSLWDRSDLLALASLVTAILSMVTAVLVVPEVRRVLKLEGPRSKRNRRKRGSLFFVFLLLWLIAGVVAWRFMIEPRLVKWRVVKAIDGPAATDTLRPPGNSTRGTQLPDSTRAIVRGSRTRDNLGGGTVVVDLWDVEAPDEVPDFAITTLFEVVQDSDALSTLAIDRIVRIHEVRLSTEPARFVVTLKLENLTDVPIEARIPKGQIFENKRPNERVQNLAARQEVPSIELPPHRVVELTIDALCVNKHWRPPNGGTGNLTVFRIRGGAFMGQNDLWTTIELAVNQAGTE